MQVKFLDIDIINLKILNFSSIFSYEYSDTNSENDMDSDIMTIKEVSEYLKLNEKTAYRLTLDGKLPAFKVGGSWRFKKTDIDSWIKQKTEGNTEEKGEK